MLLPPVLKPPVEGDSFGDSSDLTSVHAKVNGDHRRHPRHPASVELSTESGSRPTARALKGTSSSADLDLELAPGFHAAPLRDDWMVGAKVSLDGTVVVALFFDGESVGSVDDPAEALGYLRWIATFTAAAPGAVTRMSSGLAPPKPTDDVPEVPDRKPGSAE